MEKIRGQVGKGSLQHLWEVDYSLTLFNLRDKKEVETEMQSSRLWGCSSDVCSGQGWAKPKPGATDAVQIFHAGDMDVSTWAITVISQDK